MREVFIDLSQDSNTSVCTFGGYASEHKETKLIVTLPERMLGKEFNNYYFEFETVMGEHINSAFINRSDFIDENKIPVMLWEQLLPCEGDLKFCVSAEKSAAAQNNIEIKAKTVFCTLKIAASADGEDVLLDAEKNKQDLESMIETVATKAAGVYASAAEVSKNEAAEFAAASKISSTSAAASAQNAQNYANSAGLAKSAAEAAQTSAEASKTAAAQSASDSAASASAAQASAASANAAAVSANASANSAQSVIDSVPLPVYNPFFGESFVRNIINEENFFGKSGTTWSIEHLSGTNYWNFIGSAGFGEANIADCYFALPVMLPAGTYTFSTSHDEIKLMTAPMPSATVYSGTFTLTYSQLLYVVIISDNDLSIAWCQLEKGSSSTGHAFNKYEPGQVLFNSENVYIYNGIELREVIDCSSEIEQAQKSIEKIKPQYNPYMQDSKLKNLINEENFYNESGSTWSISQNTSGVTWDFKGSAGYDSHNIADCYFSLPVMLPAGTYTFSKSHDAIKLMAAPAQNAAEYSGTFTLTSEAILHVVIISDSNISAAWCQLEKGSTATSHVLNNYNPGQVVYKSEQAYVYTGIDLIEIKDPALEIETHNSSATAHSELFAKLQSKTEWVKINELTLNEDGVVSITEDSKGDSFGLSEFRAVIEFPSAGASTAKTVWAHINGLCVGSASVASSASETAAPSVGIHCKKEYYWTFESCAHQTNASVQSQVYSYPNSNRLSSAQNEQLKSQDATALKFSLTFDTSDSAAALPSGTKISVYGVKADGSGSSSNIPNGDEVTYG